MATQITNYQCPACTGPLHYAGDSGMLECDYCGSKYSVKEIEELYKEKESAASQAKADADKKAEAKDEWNVETGSWGNEADGLRTYNCPSCGAELICDESTAATACPYCGNPSIVPGQFTGGLKPDYVIPFRLGKEDAEKALSAYYKGKKLLPKVFASRNHIEEIKGVYVPFWLYSGEADADASYEATRVNTFRSGNEQVTVTDFFHVRRAGTVSFDKIPVDASSKMPDEHMDAIEPYDYSELKPFSTAYLPGYLADKYDQDSSFCADRAGQRAKNTALSSMRRSVQGYASVTPLSERVNIRSGGVKYALMPVWMLSTNYNGKNYLFAMNGQTGKLIGDLPVSRGRLLAWFAGIAVPVAALVMAILS